MQSACRPPYAGPIQGRVRVLLRDIIIIVACGFIRMTDVRKTNVRISPYVGPILGRKGVLLRDMSLLHVVSFERVKAVELQ